MLVYNIIKYKQQIRIHNLMKETNTQSNNIGTNSCNKILSRTPILHPNFPKLLTLILSLSLLLSPSAAQQLNPNNSHNPHNPHHHHLLTFANHHTKQNNLNPIPHPQPKSHYESPLHLYLYSTPEYVQLCLSDSVNGSVLPKVVLGRAYVPVFGVGDSVKCYQVFDKSLFLELPAVESPQVDLSEAGGNRKYRKQKQYLINQYNLLKWLYNFGISLDKQLVNLKLKSKSIDLSSITKFSLLLEYDGSSVILQKIWKQNDKTNQKMNNKISKKLVGRGLHQQVIYTVNLDNKNNQQYDINGEECYVSILDTLPHSTYVDVDQLKSQGFDVKLPNGSFGDGVSFIDIEKPAYLSRQYQYQILIAWNSWNNTSPNQHQIKLPIHFRYPSPYFLSSPPPPSSHKKPAQIEYIQIDLHPLTDAKIVCKNHQKLTLFEDYLVARGTAAIPVGDAEMKSAVNIVTLGGSIMCAILLIKQLRK